jgi:hypothetical protein
MNAVAFVENNGSSLTDDEIAFLCKNDNPMKTDFVRKNYEKRFTPEEALFLDNYRANVETRFFPDQIKRSLATVMIQHYVMSHCFLGGRLNSGQILAKLEHRLQHQRNDGHAMSFKLEHPPVFTGAGCVARNQDCLDFLSETAEADLAYIDPPYGGAQSDYASMFSFCEEFVYGEKLADLPHIDNAKKFATAKEFENHFRAVLEIAAKKAETVAVSFNDSSWADADRVKIIMSDYKPRVEVINMDYEYKYRKERGSATEYLFVAR